MMLLLGWMSSLVAESAGTFGGTEEGERASVL